MSSILSLYTPHTHTNTHTVTQIHSQSHKYTHSHTNTHTVTHIHTQSHKYTHRYKPHTHTKTHTVTHTYYNKYVHLINMVLGIVILISISNVISGGIREAPLGGRRLLHSQIQPCTALQYTRTKTHRQTQTKTQTQTLSGWVVDVGILLHDNIQLQRCSLFQCRLPDLRCSVAQYTLQQSTRFILVNNTIPVLYILRFVSLKCTAI